MLAFAASASRVRARLVRDLSRFGKIALLVWALVSTGYYPRPPDEMFLVQATGFVSVFGALAIAASVVLSSSKLRPCRGTIANGRLVVERDGRKRELDVERDVTNAIVHDNASEIETRDGEVWGFVHGSREEAVAFVDALGFGASGRRATFDMNVRMSVAMRFGLAFFALVSAMFVSLPFAMAGLRAFENAVPVALTGVLYQLLRFVMRKPVVTAGVDGILIDRRGRQPRFVPAREIVQASLTQSGHAFVATRDESTEIDGPNEFRQAALVTRVNALAAHETPAARVSLEREGRSVRAWRAHLRDAVIGGYRVAAEPLEKLAEQLTSRSATPEQRVGAALALRVADEGTGANRVRVAAEHCADDRLRAALEAAAEHEIDDGKLERALSRLAKRALVE